MKYYSKESKKKSSEMIYYDAKKSKKIKFVKIKFFLYSLNPR